MAVEPLSEEYPDPDLGRLAGQADSASGERFSAVLREEKNRQLPYHRPVQCPEREKDRTGSIACDLSQGT